ncbi:type I secretion system permease/ATPase [Pseudooceanicola sediminis]|uniref:Type I secretion system permease/ATPase n=1 Tax=Pseudooceanicola sediminis TaxID=2211117 RepID=A0A399J2H7_9RHOB|nr:type I secretion system permease/ATPase [Pseudooceanicola sediminis]KAA2311689.1 type I secretion system permease/ATPase [Puniceibacterium sp. HSS470]RII37146.1 type I secretion system permease/ATPase [Pseudooceanicola sediminis]|tara:strand:- start:1422 stop:3578 length:2157 start_codon:yes stop_codon:yes gene_type:complete
MSDIHDIQTERPRSARKLSPLEACMLHVTTKLDRPITHAALFAEISDPQGFLTLRDALQVAERAGLQAAFGARKLSDFDDSLTPAVLLLAGDRAVVLHRVEKTRCILYDPVVGDGLSEMAPEKLAKAYTGHAILMRPNYREDLTRQSTTEGHWFWSALAASKWSYMQVILAAMLTSVLGLSTSIFSMVVYDRILPNEATESLIALSVGIGIALLFDFGIKTLRASFIDSAGARADLLMGRRIFDQLLNLRLAARSGSTGAMANTLREFESLRDFFTSASLVALVDLPFVVLFIFVIHMIGGPLALIPAIAVPIVLVVGLLVQPFLWRLAKQSHTDGQSKQSVLVETLSGLETIKASGASRFMRARWEEAISKQSTHGAQSRAITQFALNITGLTQQAAQVLIIFYGVFLISEGVTSMGALIASVILTGRCLGPLAQLAQTLTRMNQARTSYRSLNALMNSESERPHDRKWISRPEMEGEITFEDVRFTYPNQLVETLKGISFTIKPGEKVAILGPIGSGKSTVARMLLGLYQPSSGSVRVDGVDIRQIDPGDLRRNIGAALQDPWLISGSLRDNIAIGDLRPDDAAILRAARITGVEAFAARHPAGYDMPLGEKGEGLSGGQKQAICLARSIVASPAILLLDEPTSAMDVQNENEVIRNLGTHMKNATMVIITHRPSLLDLVDRVIVLSEGKVQADGPKSLLQRASSTATPPAVGVKA